MTMARMFRFRIRSIVPSIILLTISTALAFASDVPRFDVGRPAAVDASSVIIIDMAQGEYH